MVRSIIVEVVCTRESHSRGRVHMQPEPCARWWRTCCAALLSASLVALSGCGSTKAARGTGGSGNRAGSISQGVECSPRDSTVSCCLKKHPGEYERCGAPAPDKKRRPPLPPLPSPEEQEEWNERCLDHYGRCVEETRGNTWGRKFSESQCQACWDYCKRIGEWPAEANEKPCPGR